MQHRDSMREYLGYCVERLDGSARTAGKIDDDCLAANAGDCARQDRARNFLGTLRTHAFGKTWDQSLCNSYRSLGRHIARPQACATRREDHVSACLSCHFLQERLNRRAVVSQYCERYNLPAKFLTACYHRRSRAVFKLSTTHGVTDCHDGNSHGEVCGELSFGHFGVFVRGLMLLFINQAQRLHQQTGCCARNGGARRGCIEINFKLTVGPTHRLKYSRFTFQRTEARVFALPSGKEQVASFFAPADRELA